MEDSTHPDVEVTAPVIERKLEQWEIHRLTKAQWDDLEIPEFLRRHPSGSTTTATPAATAPAAAAYGGSARGTPSEQSAIIEPPDEFAKFRVDPDEIEQKIRLEADRRWRNWVSSKGELKRPRLSTYLKRVRKEFYP